MISFFKKILIISVLLIVHSRVLNQANGIIVDSSYIQEQLYPLKKGRPTTKGIDNYVNINKFDFIKEFENYIKDTITLDVEISTDNLEEYTDFDTLDLAYHITYSDGSDEIVIDNRGKFLAYDINDLSKFKKLNLSSYNAFVKTSIMHELGHTYFLQIIIKSMYDSLEIYKEYDFINRVRLRIFPNVEEDYGTDFIDEGVSQYIIDGMKLQISNKPFIPQTINDIMDKKNEAQIKYNYSILFLRDFLNSVGLQKGIQILVTNRPPTYREILEPKLFFDRLK